MFNTGTLDLYQFRFTLKTETVSKLNWFSFFIKLFSYS